MVASWGCSALALMRKLRAASELAGTRIIAVVPKGGTTIPEQADAVMLRTLFADGFRRQLAAIAGRARKPDGVLAAQPSLRAVVGSIAQQVVGTTLRLDVQHSFEIQPRPVPRMIAATLAIDLPDTAEVLTMALRTDLASAVKLAAGMKKDAAATVSEEEGALAAAADVLAVIAGRVKTSLATAGARGELQPPTRQVAAAGDLSSGAEGRMQVTRTCGRRRQFVLQLTAAPGARAAATVRPRWRRPRCPDPAPRRSRHAPWISRRPSAARPRASRGAAAGRWLGSPPSASSPLHWYVADSRRPRRTRGGLGANRIAAWCPARIFDPRLAFGWPGSPSACGPACRAVPRRSTGAVCLRRSPWWRTTATSTRRPRSYHGAVLLIALGSTALAPPSPASRRLRVGRPDRRLPRLALAAYGRPPSPSPRG